MLHLSENREFFIRPRALSRGKFGLTEKRAPVLTSFHFYSYSIINRLVFLGQKHTSTDEALGCVELLKLRCHVSKLKISLSSCRTTMFTRQLHRLDASNGVSCAEFSELNSYHVTESDYDQSHWK